MPVAWDGYTGLGGCRLPSVTERGVIRNRAMHTQRRCKEREETTVGEVLKRRNRERHHDHGHIVQVSAMKMGAACTYPGPLIFIL